MLTDIRNHLAELFSHESSLPVEQVLGLIEIPKQAEHGFFAIPVYSLAKTLRRPPPVIAIEIAKKIAEKTAERGDVIIAKVQAVSGFVNFAIQPALLQKKLATAVKSSEGKLGWGSQGLGKKLVIDYSSPNVAKPMSIGHLRATVIGQAIRNLAQTQGYQVTGINHLGDWGVQFGKLAWAYQNWGHEYPFTEKPFESLFQLYVRFHSEAEQKPELNELGSATFRKLEQGDSAVSAIWQMFLDISLKEYQRLWDMLGVRHDLVRGESFYNDRLKDAELRLRKAGLLEESEGAEVVRLDDCEMPPCLIRKSDGSSLYATRDLASAIYRREELGADLNLYVVGVDQNLHFSQVFKVLEKMGYEWASGCHHISFGMYRFKDGRMSTRKGNVVFLEDVLDKAVAMAGEKIAEKNPDLANKEVIAKQVGVGAIIFNDLVNDRQKNVDFDWERVLDLEGSSGPYVQYCVVRCNSLINKYGKNIADEFSAELLSAEEKELVQLLLQYSDILAVSFRQFKPSILAQYLLEICRSFGTFYQKHRIIGSEPELEQSRMLLVKLTREVLAQGLGVLNIECPKAM